MENSALYIFLLLIFITPTALLSKEEGIKVEKVSEEEIIIEGIQTLDQAYLLTFRFLEYKDFPHAEWEEIKDDCELLGDGKVEYWYWEKSNKVIRVSGEKVQITKNKVDIEDINNG